MTILAKTGLKKPEKLLIPPVAPPTAPSHDDVESNDIMLVRPRNIPSVRKSTFITLLIATFVMFLGVICGYLVYKLYAREQINRFRFHGYCQFPYDSDTMDNSVMFLNSKFRDGSTEAFNSDDQYMRPIADAFKQFQDNLEKDINKIGDMFSDDSGSEIMNDSFNEEFDLQDDYAKINVPTFRDGRAGRFVHDFKMNQSGIIDLSEKRCFMYALDRSQIVPPRSMRDLIVKVWNGYYNIDTDVIRQNMRVMVPPIDDTSDVSPHIMRECSDKKIYKLEPFVNGVFKRSAHLKPNAKFAEFFGKNILEFDLVNMNEVLNYENANK